MSSKLTISDNKSKPGVGISASFIDLDISWRDFPDINWGGIFDWFDWK